MSTEVDLARILEEYAEKVGRVSNEACQEAAKSAVKELKSSSPSKHGDYARSWTYKAQPGANGSRIYTVYNKNHYRLTHLLENGHISRNQFGTYGRVPARPHIKTAETNASRELIAKLEKEL